MRFYIGIDNGTTGSIGIISENKEHISFFQTPSKLEQDYTKDKKNITRLDFLELEKALNLLIGNNFEQSLIILERPLKNPKMFNASISGIRCFESTLQVIERLGLSYMVIDSKDWQKEMLPNGVKGTPELKKASLDVGCKLFSIYSEKIKKQKDADGLLIAEWARRKNL